MQITQLFGIELPIVQAPMAGVQGSALAIAVSQAGGLGSLPCAMLAPEAIRREVAAIRAATERPFNLNFFCHVVAQPDPAAEARWRAALGPYYAEFGIDPATITAGPGRQPFGEASAELVEELAPPVLSFHFGLPEERLLERVRASGAKVLSSATTVAEARWLAERGIDAIIAQGLEAGGHRGHFLDPDLGRQLPARELLARILDATALPVIAAGGIGDAQGVASALAAGAAGVQVGSAYLLSAEANTSAVHRAALSSTMERRTALTNLFTGRPARSMVNRLMRELGPISDAPPEFPLAAAALAPLRAAAEERGSADFSPLWVGEGRAEIRAATAAEITRTLAGAR